VYIILLGAPGAGKGTQAVMLAEKLKLVQVASGDLFRQALQQETELGKLAKVYMEKGQLVPDEITIQMVLERVGKPSRIACSSSSPARHKSPGLPAALPSLTAEPKVSSIQSLMRTEIH
jgi:hypothetical protein